MPYPWLDKLWDAADLFGCPTPTIQPYGVAKAGQYIQEWVVTLVLPDGPRTFRGKSPEAAAWALMASEFPDPEDRP